MIAVSIFAEKRVSLLAMAAGAVTVMKQRSFFLSFRGIIAKA